MVAEKPEVQRVNDQARNVFCDYPSTVHKESEYITQSQGLLEPTVSQQNCILLRDCKDH